MHSLVVDDELVALSKVRSTLSLYGESDSARSGAEALDSYREAIRCKCPYEVVTIDINLPDTNGLRLLREFEILERWAGVPPAKKIMVTAEGTNAAVLQALAFKCDAFIVKPFRREFLMQKLSALGFEPMPGHRR
jgi:two-component system chemotaxis response regulator CheY